MVNYFFPKRSPNSIILKRYLLILFKKEKVWLFWLFRSKKKNNPFVLIANTKIIA